jgi:hypothetical protein
VTIVTPFIKDKQHIQGSRARWAEENKYRKYQDICHNSGYGFRAFAIDVFGYLPPKSFALLERLTSAIAFRTGRDFSLVVNDVNRQISCSLQVAIANQFLSHHSWD